MLRGPDPEVLERAQRENRVVVTFDEDFGELAFHRGLAASVGVVLFRITLTSPDHAVRVASSSSIGARWVLSSCWLLSKHEI
jgi:predicted nuclease of predicted toxin-antitoxin system